MKKLFASVCALVALLAVPGVALAGEKPKKEKKSKDTAVQLLAINDFHGHLEASSPGSIQVGCCNPVFNTATPPVQIGWTQQTVPAGGAEYLATHIKSLRTQNSNTITIGAGDLIGASPLISGLFHDEPTIEALNLIGVDVSGVGNHEFDEGSWSCCACSSAAAIRRTAARTATRSSARSSSTWRPTSCTRAPSETVLPAYEIHKVDNVKIAFIGDDARGHAADRLAGGVAGLEFRRRGGDRQRARREAANEQGVQAFVVLLHQGGFQNPPTRRPSRLGEPGRLHRRRQVRQLLGPGDHAASPKGSTRGSRS